MALALALSLLVPASGVAAEEQKRQPQQLVDSLGCKACHRISGSGATLAPDLAEVGNRMTTREIANRLLVETNSPAGFMPAYHWLTDEERLMLGQYLHQLEK